MLDTDVAIELRDRDPWIRRQIEQLTGRLYISAITRVELENGVYREAEWATVRRTAVDHMLKHLGLLEFGEPEILEYRRIVARNGYSRRKVADRMTAATALANGLAFATLNGRDFRDVAGLRLIEWERPGEGGGPEL